MVSEGWAMLRCLVADLSAIDGVQVVTTLAGPANERYLPARVLPMSESNERSVFEALAAASDWTIVIAPESGGILRQRLEWVEASGGRILGPSPQAAALTGDKLRCEGMLRAANVPTTTSCPVSIHRVPADFSFPAVLKPRDGAGSTATFRIDNAAQVADIARCAGEETDATEFLLQPFVPGLAASVALLASDDAVLPLLAGQQILSDDGRFRYLGGRIPLHAPLCDRAQTLARCAVAAVPGLRGYVGVDLVLAWPDAGDAGDAVIEINPRLTTSYVGLRELARDNLARRMLDMAAGRPVEPIAWRCGPAVFTADRCRVDARGL